MTAQAAQVRETLAWLERRGTRRNVEGMARYGITSPRAFGVSVNDIRALAKQLGRNHELAVALWNSGWYEARMLAAFVDEPVRVTPAQMDRWARDFDNWAVCDGVCFHLFDRTPHALAKVTQWSTRREEFVKRAAFALLAGVGLHVKTLTDEDFLSFFPVIVRAASDDRNFVKKGVSWALRSLGQRSTTLHEAALTVARELQASADRAERWVGQDAVRDLTRPIVAARLARRAAAGTKRPARRGTKRPANSGAKTTATTRTNTATTTRARMSRAVTSPSTTRRT